MITVRKSKERGLADHGWLKSRHSFSFAEYRDPKHMGFGVLRVINEDRIAGGSGFGQHPHRDMEIISYVVQGALQHQDSMGNSTVIRPGDVQRMSAGTGVVHSEMNGEGASETHFFQIWIVPEKNGLTPGYGQTNFSAQLAANQPVLVVSKDGRDGSITINQDVDIYLARIKPDASLAMKVSGGKVWIQVIAGSVTVMDQRLDAGDGAALEKESVLELSAVVQTELILFDLKHT